MNKVNTFLKRVYMHFRSDSLYRNSIYLILNSGVLGLFSFGFWIFAARAYSSNVVGVVSVLFSAATLLATLSYFGFDYALIKYIPGSKKANLRTSTGLNFTAILSVIFSIIYLCLIPVTLKRLGFLDSSLWWVFGFVVLVIMTTWNTLTNSLFIAHRIAEFALITSLIFTVLRLPILYILKSYGASGLILSQIISLITSVLFSLIFLRRKADYKYNFKFSKVELKHMSSYTFGTYLSNISGGLPALILPTIILRVLDSKLAAYFYIANIIASLLYVIPNAVSQSFFSEGTWDNKNIDNLLKQAAKLISIFVIMGVAILIVFGWLILSAFGKAYAQHGYILLVLLSITAIPKIVSYLFSTVLRINSRIKPVIVVSVIGTAIQLSLSYVGIRHTSNLFTLGIAALACEIFVSGSYTLIYFTYKRKGYFIS